MISMRREKNFSCISEDRVMCLVAEGVVGFSMHRQRLKLRLGTGKQKGGCEYKEEQLEQQDSKLLREFPGNVNL